MAAPIKGTKQSDLNIVGTNKADKLQGKDGNDFITGGKGNDDIDGGNGFDTAVYSGSFFDYTITQLGTGNNKTTVTDSVADRDGSDALKQVEALKFGDGSTLLLTQNNAAFTRDDTASTNEDAPVTINVLANDKDFENDALTITQVDGQAITVGGSVTLASGATVTLNADQTLTYDPTGAFDYLHGDEGALDGFSYVVTDSHGASSTGGVGVGVDGVWEAANYVVNGTVDEAGQKPATTDLWNGSGIPATGFGLVQVEDAGLELGLQVIYRQGPTVLSTDDYTDGVLSYQVNAGPQSTANGSSGNNAARAAWSFEYSIVTGLNGETTGLDDFTFKLLVDKDPTAAIDYNELLMRTEPLAPGSADTVWKLLGPDTDVIGDDAGVSGQVAQNSQNISFGFYGLGAYSGAGFPAGQFDITLQAFDSMNALIAENHIQVNVV